jgi:hypothetical protein
MELQKKKRNCIFFSPCSLKIQNNLFYFLDEEKGKYFPVYRNVFKIFISFFRFNPPFFEFHLERERGNNKRKKERKRK